MSGRNPPPPPPGVPGGIPPGSPPGGPGGPVGHPGPAGGAPYGPGGGTPVAPGGGPYGGPPRRKGRPGLLIGLPVGLLVVLLLGVAGIFGGYMVITGHTLSTPPSAGGMARAADVEGQKAVVDMREKLESVIRRTSDYKIYDFVSAVYRDGGLTYLFVGGMGEHDAGITDEQTYKVMGRLDYAVEEVFRAGGNDVQYDASTSSIAGNGLGDIEMSTSITATVYTPSGSRAGFSRLGAWSTRTTFGLVALGPGGSPDQREAAETTRKMQDIRASVED